LLGAIVIGCRGGAQSIVEPALRNFADRAIDRVRRFSAAERADQFLLGWIPFRLRAARRARVFLAC
jgi:hypothetical protein